MDDVSLDLERDLKDRLMNDSGLQQSIKGREKLPVHNKKAEIMNAVTENRVIIIRGNTGCGKTTQVSDKKVFTRMYRNNRCYNRGCNPFAGLSVYP